MNRITTLDCRAAINRLRFAFPLPKGIEERGGVDQLAEIWAGVLRGLSTDDLERGLDAVFREHSGYFPKPSQVREFCRNNRSESSRPTDLGSRYRRWEVCPEGACPVCGAGLKALAAEHRAVPDRVWDPDLRSMRPLKTGEELPTRFGVLHDAERHRREGVPHIGAPYYQPETEESADTEGVG